MANKTVNKFRFTDYDVYVEDTTAREGVSDINTDLATRPTRTEFNNLTLRVNALDDEVETIETVNRPLSVLLIGDSYLLGSGLAQPSSQNWGELVRSRLGLVAGTTFYSYGGSGYGFSKGEGYNFSELVQQAVSGMTTVQKASVTDIVIGGGANDWSDTEERRLNITNSFSAIKGSIGNDFGNGDVRVHVVAMGWNCMYPRRVDLPNVYSHYARLCSLNGWSYYECYPVLQNKEYLNADGVHPNSSGQDAIASCVTNFLLGSSYQLDNGNRAWSLRINDVTIGRAIVSGKNVVLHFYKIAINNVNEAQACNVNQSMGTVGCAILLGGKSSENNCYFTIPVILNEGVDDIYTNAEISIRKPTADEDIGRDTALSFVVRIRGVENSPLLNSITPLGSMITIPFPVA